MRPELDLLRPALEMAIIVARQGETAPVRIEAPRPIRPFLHFSRLPPPALKAARVALEDEEFRRRVVERCDEEEVGRAGWLLLTRPDEWESELQSLIEERFERGDADAERSARREMRRLQGALHELQRRADDQSREVTRLRQQAADRAAGDHRRDVELAEARVAVVTAADERARAVRELKAMERRLAERTAELKAVRDDLRSGAAVGDPDRDGPDAHEAGPDLEALAALVAGLGAGWRSLGPMLGDLESLVGVGDSRDDDGGEGAGGGEGAAALRGSPRRRGGTARRPVRLGGGLVDDTPEAARHLLGLPGALALVDGYNVSMLAWPELSVTDQRTVLERAASQVQLQYGAQLVLVFDGDDDGGAAVRSAVGSPVRVRYTDADTEADDVILEMIPTLAAAVVIVVSNDRRVIDGARQRGANVVRSTDFVKLLR